jgi:hypothetical protein
MAPDAHTSGVISLALCGPESRDERCRLRNAQRLDRRATAHRVDSVLVAKALIACEAQEDLALKNCAPISVPRRHVTDAQYPGPLLDKNKRNLSGML